MTSSDQFKPRRILIASRHALFGQGLRSLLLERKQVEVEIVGIVTDLNKVMDALDQLKPDLVIVDYDDEMLNRDEFLTRFVEGDQQMRVVLLSLQGDNNAIVYDRRSMAASQIDHWLNEWDFG